MARPERNNVDYFPHPVKHKKKMFFIEKKYGNDGYATWFKLLEVLGENNYHYIDLIDKNDMMYMSSKCDVSEEKLILIIDDLIKFGEFDQKLWESEKILFNQNFVDTIIDAYKKRGNECVDGVGGLRVLLTSIGRLKPSLRKSKGAVNGVKGAVNPQSKEEKSKEEKTKARAGVKNNIFYPDWLDLKLWNEFKNNRKKLKAPMTDEAEKRLIAELEKLTQNGSTQDDIIGQSIMNGWKGLFEIKKFNNNLSRTEQNLYECKKFLSGEYK